MGPILRSYFYRLFREKAFYIELGISFGLTLVVSLIVRLVLSGVKDAAPTLSSAIMTGFTGGDVLGTSSIPWISLFLFTIFGAVRYRKETISGAMRNYIVSGYSRGQTFHALLIGNFVFYVLLSLSIALGVILPFLGCPFGIEGSAVGDFFLSLGLCVLLDIAYFLFIYFTFVLMNGHGFAGSLATLVFVGLSLIGTVAILVVAANAGNVGAEGVKGVFLGLGWLLPSNRGALASGVPGTIPNGSAAMVLITSKEILAALKSVDWVRYNVVTALLTALALGGASYGFGLLIAAKRDLK